MYSEYLTLGTQIFIAIIFANILMGAMTFFYGEKKSISRYIFLCFLVSQVLWLLSNFTLFVSGEKLYLFLTRLTAFFATFHAYFFFLFVYTYLENIEIFKNKVFIFTTIFWTIAAPFTLTPLVFTSYVIDTTGQLVPQPGPAIGVFGGFVGFCVIATFITLYRKYQSSAEEKRLLYKLLSAGVVLTFLLIIALSFFSVVFLGNINSVRFGHIYTLPFMLMTSYLMVRHDFLNLKPILTEAAVIFFNFVLLFDLFTSSTLGESIRNGLLTVGSIFFGYLIIKSVKKEIKASEEVRTLANQLAKTNWELAKSNEQLRIIDQRKNEFVSIVSHQLRTPITAIKGYVSLLLDGTYGELPEVMNDPVAKVFRSSERLVKMVEDYLDISKIEQGTMSYDIGPVDIGRILRELVDEFTPIAAKQELSLALSVPDSERFIATVDEGKIRQIFSNIIDNAIKYTPRGSVWVIARKSDPPGMLVVEIRDTGIGLSPDDIQHLFGKFMRGLHGQKRNTEGSGLGLYVAKKMVEAQGGKIWIDSDGPGRGTVVTLELKEHESVIADRERAARAGATQRGGNDAPSTGVAQDEVL